MRLSLLLFLPFAAWLNGSLAALAETGDSQLCIRAIGAAEQNLRTPERLLSAIGLVESGRPDPKTGAVRPWPWTLNAEGTGRYFETKAEAISAVEELQARGVRSIDVGCMQVNLMHHPTAFASLDEAFDPQANAIYAARFLTALYHDLGTWPRATAAYHSQTQDIGTDYARKVMAVWGKPYLMPTPAPAQREVETVFAAFSAPSAQYRAFAPETALFGAFARPGTIPTSLRGYAGLPLEEAHKKPGARQRTGAR